MPLKVIDDSRGVAAIPVRLIISITVIAAISALFYIGVQNFVLVKEAGDVEQQVTSLDVMLQEMITGSARDLTINENYKIHPGQRRVFEFNLPSKLSYLGIGVDPDPDNNGVLSRGLTDNGKVIVYNIEGRSKQRYWIEGSIRVRLGAYENRNWVIKEPEEGLVIRDGGKCEVVFETVQKSDKKYILIHENNSASLPYHDGEDPMVIITNPDGEETTLPYGSVTIQWIARDNIAVQTISIAYHNTTSDWRLLEERDAAQWDEYEYTIEEDLLDPNEEYWVRVTATDQAGNEASDSVHIFFT